MQNVLSPYEVTPPEQYKTNKPKRMYWGLCHKKAYDYMMNLKDRENVVCCQGDIINPSREGMTGGHAWIELPGELIFDGVLQRFYTREGYYNILKPDVKLRLTFTELNELALKHRCFALYYNPEITVV